MGLRTPGLAPHPTEPVSKLAPSLIRYSLLIPLFSFKCLHYRELWKAVLVKAERKLSHACDK